MGRPHRIVDTESIYHVFARGNNKSRIAWDGDDGETYLDELGAAAERYRWDVFAWCLMPNHHHVVLRAPHDGLSEGFRLLNGNYSRRTNRRHDRVDHLFRNRFGWRNVSSDAYLIGALTYVVRNPVAGDLCSHAGEWRYSSYRATVGQAPRPRWLVVDQVLRLFGTTPQQARAAFDVLVHRGRLVVSDTEGERRPSEPRPVRT